MTNLRIWFEVNEEDVGACLVALEGKAKHLNFEIVKELPYDKNAKKTMAKKPKHPQKANTPVKSIVLALLRKAGPKGKTTRELLDVLNGRGFSPVIRSLYKHGKVKSAQSGGHCLIKEQTNG